MFGIDEEKLDLLPAGADDEKIDYHNRSTIKKEICDKYDISNDDFLVITGGKIDEKKNIDKLMEAVTKIDNPKINSLLCIPLYDGNLTKPLIILFHLIYMLHHQSILNQ